MKLNFGKRLVLFLHWLLALIGCALAVLLLVWPETAARGFTFCYDLIGKGKTDIIGACFLGIYVVLMLLTVYFIFSNPEKRSERGFITVDSSDTGKTRIAVSAVEQMVKQSVISIEGIDDMKIAILNGDDAISIRVNLSILSGVHVPTVTMNVQRSIRSYIELNCGVAVRDVSVNVHSVNNPDEGGKRGRKKSQQSAPYVPTMVKPAEPAAQPVYQPEPQAEAAAPEASNDFARSSFEVKVPSVMDAEPAAETETASADETPSSDPE